jgi:hypothetical protein
MRGLLSVRAIVVVSALVLCSCALRPAALSSDFPASGAIVLTMESGGAGSRIVSYSAGKLTLVASDVRIPWRPELVSIVAPNGLLMIAQSPTGNKIVNLVTGETGSLTGDVILCAAWTPDSSKVAYITAPPEEIGKAARTTPSRLYVYTVGSEEPVLIDSSKHASNPFGVTLYGRMDCGVFLGSSTMIYSDTEVPKTVPSGQITDDEVGPNSAWMITDIDSIRTRRRVQWPADALPDAKVKDRCGGKVMLATRHGQTIYQMSDSGPLTSMERIPVDITKSYEFGYVPGRCEQVYMLRHRPPSFIEQLQTLMSTTSRHMIQVFDIRRGGQLVYERDLGLQSGQVIGIAGRPFLVNTLGKLMVIELETGAQTVVPETDLPMRGDIVRVLAWHPDR